MTQSFNPLILLMIAGYISQVEPTPRIPWGGTDFVQYYVAWQQILDDHNPYDRLEGRNRPLALGLDVPSPMFAPPWALLPSFVTARLTFYQACIVNVVINAMLILIIVALWASLLYSKPIRIIPWYMIFALLWLPTLQVLGLGQLSLWPLCGFTGWVWAISRQRPVWAGASLFLCIMKPHLGIMPCLFAISFLMRNRIWKCIYALAITFIISSVIITIIRPGIWSEYLATIGDSTSPAQYFPATLDGWLRAYSSRSWKYATWSLWVIAVIITINIGWRTKNVNTNKNIIIDNEEYQILCRRAVITLIGSIVFVPYCWANDYVFMLPAIFMTFAKWLMGDYKAKMAMFAWTMCYICLIQLFIAEVRFHHYWIVPWIGMVNTVYMMVPSPLQMRKTNCEPKRGTV